MSKSIQFSSRSDRGKVRRKNEDYLAIDESQAIAAIADGIGGNAFGEVASQMAVDACMEYLTESDDELKQKPENALANAVRFANEAIIAVQRNNSEYSKMGCTLSCFTLVGQQLVFSWVGDSRIYRIQPALERLEQLSKDHTLDPSKIDPELAPRLRKSAASILTQKVGSILLLQPETGSVELDTGDIVLACTDGLTDRVNDKILLEYAVKYCDEIDKLTEQLLDRALDCGGQDNISMILARVGGGF